MMPQGSFDQFQRGSEGGGQLAVVTARSMPVSSCDLATDARAFRIEGERLVQAGRRKRDRFHKTGVGSGPGISFPGDVDGRRLSTK